MGILTNETARFKKLYTEILSLTRIFHEKAASTGSRVSFLKNRGPIKTTKKKGNAEKKNQEKSALLRIIMIFLFFPMFFNLWALYPMNLRDFLILYTEIPSSNWIFYENWPVTGSLVGFIENRGSIKSIKERGGR